LPTGGILVFLTGKKEITDMVYRLELSLKTHKKAKKVIQKKQVE
jgi:HrpA-like RNA helicase